MPGAIPWHRPPEGPGEWHEEKRPDTRPNAYRRGYGPRWAKYRKMYISQNPLCITCGRPATDVDHITPVTGPEDPTFFLPSAHQALCHSCHSRKTAAEGSAAERWVIIGPPGIGRATWVEERRKRGDLVWDLDAIAATIAQEPGHPRSPRTLSVLKDLRGAFLDWAAANPRASVYIIVSDPEEGRQVARDVFAKVQQVGGEV